MGQQFDPRAGRSHGEPTVPLIAMASCNDVDHAEELLVVHVPHIVTQTYCTACQTPWPCAEVRFARAITAGEAIWAGPGA